MGGLHDPAFRTGLDYVTASTGAVTSLTNVGPGLGDIIGRSATIRPVPDAAKWILSVAMLLGRLEILAVLVLFTPAFWAAEAGIRRPCGTGTSPPVSAT